MPQYSYRATDASGQQRQGTLAAANENDLISRLSAAGLRVLSIGAVTAPAPLAPAPRPQPPVAAPKPIASPVARAETRGHQEAPVGARRSARPPVRTKRASYRELMFLFAQFATLLRSGISPADSCTRAGGNASRPHIRAALADMARMTAQGHNLADAMASYPDIFPDGAVGAVRAGETGGYTWEACDALRNQYEQANKMVWGLRLFRWVVLFGLLGLPMIFALMRGLDYSFATLGGLPALIVGTGKALTGPIGWLFFGMWAGYLALAWWGRKTEQRPVRHGIAARLPFFSSRAKAEALSAFTWHLGRLSAAGLAPSTAWSLAASAVPNEALGARYAQTGAAAHEGTRMADIARQTDLIPVEYRGVIETGEVTGTLPQAFEHTSRMAEGDRQTADRRAKLSLYGAYILFFMGVSILAGVSFYSGYINSLLKHTVGETEEGR